MNKRSFAILGILITFLFLFRIGVQSHENSKNILLGTVGGLSAQGVYLTYVSIGTLADGYVYKAFNKKMATSLLGEYIGLAGNSKNLLKKLIDQKIVSGRDINFVKDLIITYDLLIAEANAFRQYVATDDKNQIKIYDSNRKKAWAKISKLLNIK